MRTGYKETALGEIPESWRVSKIRDVLKIGSGKDYKHLESGDIPVFGTGGYMTSVNDYLYEGDSVGIGRKGTIDKPVFLQGKFWTVDTLFYTHSFEKVTPYYIYLVFQTINWRLLNEATGVPSLSKPIIENVKFPLPPLPEQQKIATILSTVDEKIEIIDQRISQTRELKKGLMQKLLTKGIGHTQFKNSELGEIPENWEVVKVKDITQAHKQGYYTKEEYKSEGIKLVRVTDLKNPKVDYSDMPHLSISEKDYADFKIEKGDFLFARSGAIGRYGIVKDDLYPAIFGSYLIRFKFNKKIDSSFFGYFYESGLCRRQLNAISQGNANININAENIKSLNLPRPGISEQKKIAIILSTVDEKLDVLVEKKSHYQELKKGLMQKLLTGKVRVKV